MKQTRLIMGMPITVEIAAAGRPADLEAVFAYFRAVDQRFSPYKKDSELARLNAGLPPAKWSPDMKLIVKLCDQTKHLSGGYFNAFRRGYFDPSGLVKGWAIKNAALILKKRGFDNFYVEAGGDIEVSGLSPLGRPWRIGIRNPFQLDEIIKVVELGSGAVATSGTYVRGTHIYNPLKNYAQASEIKSLSVIGPDIFEADRLATAAFAMGRAGLKFIASQPGLEGYLVDNDLRALYTPGFERFVGSAQVA